MDPVPQPKGARTMRIQPPDDSFAAVDPTLSTPLRPPPVPHARPWPLLLLIFVVAVAASLVGWAWGTVRVAYRPRPFAALPGFFAQEGGNMGLNRTRSGLVESLGALVPWAEVHRSLGPRRKLVFLVRHAEGVHNHAQDVMGRARWYLECAEHCSCKADGDMFDAELTARGLRQARALNHALRREGLMRLIAPDLSALRVLTSPLRRAVHTTLEALRGVHVGTVTATELCRESVGVFPCDARRSVSGIQGPSPCPVSRGLRDIFPRGVDFSLSDANISIPATPEQQEAYLLRGAPLGLIGDGDTVWSNTRRETSADRVIRSNLLLASVFDHVPQPVVWITTHAGLIRDATAALGLPPYFANNCDVVPMVVEDRRRPEGQ